jgi:hypothetical protein
MGFGTGDLLTYWRSHRLAVVSSIGEEGGSQAALVGIAVRVFPDYAPESLTKLRVIPPDGPEVTVTVPIASGSQ